VKLVCKQKIQSQFLAACRSDSRGTRKHGLLVLSLSFFDLCEESSPTRSALSGESRGALSAVDIFSGAPTAGLLDINQQHDQIKLSFACLIPSLRWDLMMEEKSPP
jgi:hypothetical protein